jgi:hypothetical protein
VLQVRLAEGGQVAFGAAAGVAQDLPLGEGSGDRHVVRRKSGQRLVQPEPQLGSDASR